MHVYPSEHGIPEAPLLSSRYRIRSVPVRYRLCGTKVTELRGCLTGHCLDQVSAKDLRGMAGQCEVAAAKRRPVFNLGWLTGKLGASHPFQAGIWPLENEGQPIDACIAVEDFPKLQRAASRRSAVLQAS